MQPDPTFYYMINESFTFLKTSINSDDIYQLCYLVACDKSYGENCQYLCSPHCINQTCDRFNGTCLTSCKDNYGDKCIPGNFDIYFSKYVHVINKWLNSLIISFTL